MSSKKFLFRSYLLFITLFTLPTLCFPQLAVEIGPSYIVNLSHSTWNNADGLNLIVKYQIAHHISVTPKFSFYKFSSETKSEYNLYDSFLGISTSANENSFYDLSVGIRLETNENIITPIFSLRSGIHFIKFAYNSGSQILDSKVNREQQRRIGFFGAGFGIQIRASERIKIITKGEFSVSFDTNYIFVPIDLLIQINL